MQCLCLQYELSYQQYLHQPVKVPVEPAKLVPSLLFGVPLNPVALPVTLTSQCTTTEKLLIVLTPVANISPSELAVSQTRNNTSCCS